MTHRHLAPAWPTWLAGLLLGLLGAIGASWAQLEAVPSPGHQMMAAPPGLAAPCHEAVAPTNTDRAHGVPAATGHAASPACCVAACLLAAQCVPMLPTDSWPGFVPGGTLPPGQATTRYVSVVHRPPLPPPQILVSI